MPKFVIERQYLVPMYQHIVVEAETLGEACKEATSDDIGWDSQEMDCDGARKTAVTVAKMVPEGYQADQIHCLIIGSRDPKGLPWTCSASPRSSIRMRRRLARSSRSPRNLLKTNNPPRPLGSS